MDSVVKDKILRSEEDKAKLQEEIDAKASEHGMRGVVPLNGQDQFQVLKDLKDNGKHFEESMRNKEQQDAAVRAARRQARASSTTPRMSEETYHRMKEAKEKAAYEARKIRM